MCLGSDVGGINRRPLKVIFTLETSQEVVVGRKVFDVRICSCPKRDKHQEEERIFTQATMVVTSGKTSDLEYIPDPYDFEDDWGWDKKDIAEDTEVNNFVKLRNFH